MDQIGWRYYTKNLQWIAIEDLRWGENDGAWMFLPPTARCSTPFATPRAAGGSGESMTSYIHGRRLAAGLLLAIAASAGATAVASTPAPHLEHSPVVTFDRKHLSKGLLAYVRFTKEVARTSKGTPQVRLGLSAPTVVPVATAGRLDAEPGPVTRRGCSQG